MVLSKRYCVTFDDGSVQCYDDDSFWYTDKGMIIKWAILGLIFLAFTAWFLGGYIHAKQRLKQGKPLLAYHRFLIPYSQRARFGQTPQNHFTFYQPHNPNPYAPQNQQPYTQRQDGGYAEPPPLYANHDAPPQYFAPSGPTKAGVQHVEMPMYGRPHGQLQGEPQGGQQSGVVGGSSMADVEQQELPPRPQRARVTGWVDRLRR